MPQDASEKIQTSTKIPTPRWLEVSSPTKNLKKKLLKKNGAKHAKEKKNPPELKEEVEREDSKELCI